MSQVRVLLVDDSPRFLEALGRFLSFETSVAVVGQALSGLEALEQAMRLGPDLVLLDWAMPHMSGLETARRLKALPNAPYVVMVTLYDSPEFRAAARAAGAEELLSKTDLATHLLPLICDLFSMRTLPDCSLRK